MSELLIKHLYERDFKTNNKAVYNILNGLLEKNQTNSSVAIVSACNVARCAIAYYKLSMKKSLTHEEGNQMNTFMLYAYRLVRGDAKKENDILKLYTPFTNDLKDDSIRTLVLTSRTLMNKFLTEDKRKFLKQAYKRLGYPIKELDYIDGGNVSNDNSLAYYIINEDLKYHERIDLMIKIVEKLKDIIEKSDPKEQNLLKDVVNIYNFTIVKENNKTEVDFGENKIEDRRLSNNLRYTKTFSIVYQLGIIFYQILTKSPCIPEILNSDQNEIDWNTILYWAYRNYTISSLSMAILQSCLYDRSWDTKNMPMYFHDSVHKKKKSLLKIEDPKDIINDPPKILDESDFLFYLNKEKTFLEIYGLKNFYSNTDKLEELDDVIYMTTKPISNNIVKK